MSRVSEGKFVCHIRILYSFEFFKNVLTAAFFCVIPIVIISRPSFGGDDITVRTAHGDRTSCVVLLFYPWRTKSCIKNFVICPRSFSIEYGDGMVQGYECCIVRNSGSGRNARPRHCVRKQIAPNSLLAIPVLTVLIVFIYPVIILILILHFS